jgi:hypothetical protein
MAGTNKFINVEEIACPSCRPPPASRETWLAAVDLARRLAAGAKR